MESAKNQSATQRSGCRLERKKEGADMEFSASAGNGMERVSSDAGIAPYKVWGKNVKTGGWDLESFSSFFAGIRV